MSEFVDTLPAINASWNAVAAVCLVVGLIHAKRGNHALHQRFVQAALLATLLFLTGYAIRVGLRGATHFQGPAGVRMVYLVMLISHMCTALLTFPLVGRAVYLAVKKRFPEHRRIVRYAAPIWLYTSVTGVLVYFSLYHLSPALMQGAP